MNSVDLPGSGTGRPPLPPLTSPSSSGARDSCDNSSVMKSSGSTGNRRGHRRSASTPTEDLEAWDRTRTGSMETMAGEDEELGSKVPRVSQNGSDSGDVNTDDLQKLVAESYAVGMPLDPKRAKRILANRLSAARSKERKIKYVSDLQTRVSFLQASISASTVQIAQWDSQTQLLNEERDKLEDYVKQITASGQKLASESTALEREIAALEAQAAQRRVATSHA